MRMPTPSEKKRMIESFRPRFLPMVNPEKKSWNELTQKEKKELDKICARHYLFIQF